MTVANSLILGAALALASAPPPFASEAEPPTRAHSPDSKWRPFEPVRRPGVPLATAPWVRNPIDAFVAAKHTEQGLSARGEAARTVWLRRVSLDLIGISPSPEEIEHFLRDNSPAAHERVVDRLLQDPRYGERWGRHWMDIWRYSDWAGWSGGNQIRDSQPHIWRWRDWIIESLNADKGYDRMLVEMLAADELAADDPDALRATGYLVRNFKMLSREQWLSDTVKHTSQAFLGLTIGCAQCHDHRYDPVSQEEYFRFRAIFEPHKVRIDRVPGELDRKKDGLARAYDADLNAATYFYIRGDERMPDTNRVITPGVPRFLAGVFEPARVALPRNAAFPDRREFIRRELKEASEAEVRRTQHRFEELQAANAAHELRAAELEFNLAHARNVSLEATLSLEDLETASGKENAEWREAARMALTAQRHEALCEAELKLHRAESDKAEAESKIAEAGRKAAEFTGQESPEAKSARAAFEKAKQALDPARKKIEEARADVAKAGEALNLPAGAEPAPRPQDVFPGSSTGRRLAFARWLTHPDNPLTARVAVNHIWLRHFGRGIVPTPADFGANGAVASHPELLDWLAAELMASNWSMKAIHRLIATSGLYRMASTPDPANLAVDPDNLWLWRMPSRRMEAELIRDNLLRASGNLDLVMGGPEIDQSLGFKSARRSLYFRIAAEKEVEFLAAFDGPKVTECYQRASSVLPQQALALSNSALALRQARQLSEALSGCAGDDDFVRTAFLRVLAREPAAGEMELCRGFLRNGPAPKEDRARENLILVLMNHNDFVTIR